MEQPQDNKEKLIAELLADKDAVKDRLNKIKLEQEGVHDQMDEAYTDLQKEYSAELGRLDEIEAELKNLGYSEEVI